MNTPTELGNNNLISKISVQICTHLQQVKQRDQKAKVYTPAATSRSQLSSLWVTFEIFQWKPQRWFHGHCPGDFRWSPPSWLVETSSCIPPSYTARLAPPPLCPRGHDWHTAGSRGRRNLLHHELRMGSLGALFHSLDEIFFFLLRGCSRWNLCHSG